MPSSLKLTQRSLTGLFFLLVMMLFAQHHAVAALVDPSIPKPIIEDVATLIILIGMYAIFSYKQRLQERNEKMGRVITDLSRSIGGMNRKQSILEEIGSLLQLADDQEMSKRQKKIIAKRLVDFAAMMLSAREYVFRLIDKNGITIFETSNTEQVRLPGNKALLALQASTKDLHVFVIGTSRACISVGSTKEGPSYTLDEVQAIFRIVAAICR